MASSKPGGGRIGDNGLRYIGRPREGPSATLLSEGIHRSPRRMPDTRTREHNSRSGACNRRVPDLPFPAANVKVMLSPKNKPRFPKLSESRKKWRTENVSPLASERVMCSDERNFPTYTVVQGCFSKNSRGTSSHNPALPSGPPTCPNAL